jgi:pantothenate kinase-related protein Tda10
MDKPLVVNLFGGPGVGKSTCAAAIFSLLKLHNVNVELITEFAKDLTWEGRYKALDNQIYVFAKQYHKMWRVRNQVEVMVTDSPILLSQIYGACNANCFNEMILHAFNEFNNLNYVLVRTDKKKFNPVGRNQNEEESKIIDARIVDMLTHSGIQHRNVLSNYDGINEVTKNVLGFLNKEMEIAFDFTDEIGY